MYSDYIIDNEAGYNELMMMMMMMITLTQMGNHADVVSLYGLNLLIKGLNFISGM